MEGKRALCICVSNRRNGKDVGRCICTMVMSAFGKKNICVEAVELQEASLTPCTGCGGCSDRHRCTEDESFNEIYEKITEADYLFFISPHHAPVPARLCMLLEKMVQLAANGRQKDSSGACGYCKATFSGKLAGIISYGTGGEQMLMHCKVMVNDTVADALRDAQLKVVPFNSEWNTGISIPITEKSQGEEDFGEASHVLECGGKQAEEKVGMYVEIVVQTSRTLHAIL